MSDEQTEHAALVVAAGVPSWMPLWACACQELHAVCEATVSEDPARDLNMAMTIADDVYREVLRTDFWMWQVGRSEQEPDAGS